MIQQVRIENYDQVIRNFRGIADDQIPYATALSLTRTAKLAQGSVQEQLPARFTIRQLQFMKSGVRIQAATKQALVAIVQDIHAFMVLQEEGGMKMPHFGRYVAVPLSGVRPWFSRKLVDPKDLPSAVMASGLGFIRGNVMYRANFARSQSRRGFKGVKGFQTGAWSRKIVPMYALVPKAKIPERYGFEDLVRAVVGANWETEFGKAFNQAVETRR